MKTKDLVQAFLKNKEIVEHHNISWLLGAFLFAISIFLATIPFYMSAFTPTNYDAYFPNIGDSLVAFLDANECTIQQETLTCQQGESIQTFGEYHYALLGNQSIAEPNTLYFQANAFVLDNGTGTVVQGDYANVGDFTFSKVGTMLGEGGLSNREFANVMLKNIELSAVAINMMTITMTFVVQYGFYCLVLAYLFKFAKGKRDHWPYGYGDHVKMILISMVLPALAGAVCALYLPSVASIIFPFAFVIRVVFLYMRLARHTQ